MAKEKESEAKLEGLPTTKSEPVFSMSRMRMLLYGAPKIGKSTFCSQIPDALFLSTEEGLNHLSVYSKTINTWQDLKNVGSLLVSTEHKFKTIIIDTVDAALNLCEQHVAQSNGVSHISDIKFIGSALVADEFMRVMMKLSKLGLGVIFIAHSEEKTIKRKDKEEVHKTQICLQSKTKDRLTAFCDIIAYCTTVYLKRGENEYEYVRVLKTQPNSEHETGDRTNRLVDNIPLNYEDFRQALERNTKD